MKIAFFTNQYLPIKGGVTSSVLSHKQYLEKQGHTCYVFAPKFDSYQDKDPNVFRYPALQWKTKGIEYPVTLLDSKKIRDQFAKLKVDIIHAQHPFTFGKIAYKYARKYKIPIVFTYHSQYEQYAHYFPLPNFLDKAVGFGARAWAILFAKKNQKVITVGQAMKDYLDKKGLVDKIVLIPTGIDSSHFDINKKDNEEKTSELKSHLGIKKGDKVIIHVGRLNEEKNFQFLYESIKDLLIKDQNLKFIVVGPGVLLDYYKAKAKLDNLEKQVILTGPINWDLVPDYLSVGDVFVFASETEAQGLVVNEAQAMGLPVVAIRASGVEDAVIDKKTGFLVEEDKKEFEAKVDLLVKNRDLRHTMGKNAYNNSLNFSQERMGEKLLLLYKQVIDNYKAKY